MGVWVRRSRRILCILIMVSIGAFLPLKASSEVAPITDIEDKLDGITEEEKAVLEDLFTIQQEIDDTKRQESEISERIDQQFKQIKVLQIQIQDKQKDYDHQLGTLKQMLVNYQRGGPASYLEILLKADNLSDFLKSLNIIKDISHNLDQLLSSLEQGKQELVEEKTRLDGKNRQLKQTKQELENKINEEEKLQKDMEDYLASLQENRGFYENQLELVANMWDECQLFFPAIVSEISKIIEAGYFTENDLNLKYNIFTIQGYLKEDTFNKILSDHSTYTNTVFQFTQDEVVIDVPERRLILNGNFVIDGKKAIKYEVSSGSFYGMPLEQDSIGELFKNGPLLIDFSKITGDFEMIDFKINEVHSEDGTLNFTIMPQY